MSDRVLSFLNSPWACQHDLDHGLGPIEHVLLAFQQLACMCPYHLCLLLLDWDSTQSTLNCDNKFT